jgi:hypothetical protein
MPRSWVGSNGIQPCEGDQNSIQAGLGEGSIGEGRPRPIYQRVDDLYRARRESSRDGTVVFL